MFSLPNIGGFQLICQPSLEVPFHLSQNADFQPSGIRIILGKHGNCETLTSSKISVSLVTTLESQQNVSEKFSNSTGHCHPWSIVHGPMAFFDRSVQHVGLVSYWVLRVAFPKKGAKDDKRALMRCADQEDCHCRGHQVWSFRLGTYGT